MANETFRLLGALLATSLLACSAGDAQKNQVRNNNPNGQGGGTGGIDLGTGGTGPSLGGSFNGSGGAFGCATTVSGTVYDPAGRLPLYNVVVYVPSMPLDPIAEGASCETCDGNFSGRPIAAALSDASGRFTLDLTNVPSGPSIPLVVQVGKWRREMTIENAEACEDTPLADGTVRLPANRSEGNLPKIGVVRGGSDSLECLFRKIGISDSEFTLDTGDGRVHLYVNDGTEDAPTGQLATGENLALSSTLYADLTKMMSYDVLFLGCDGQGRDTYNAAPAISFTNIQSYADQGGRIFGSHYHGYWVRTEKFEDKGVTYPQVVVHPSSEGDIGVAIADVNMTFPKGQALGDWLLAVGGSTELGKLPIVEGQHFTEAVIDGTTTTWITAPFNGQPSIQYHSFTTPVGQAECGRMVFSDLHMGSPGDDAELAFPTCCGSTELSPQEKALAFMLFDLSSCVQADSEPPKPPTVF